FWSFWICMQLSHPVCQDVPAQKRVVAGALCQQNARRTLLCMSISLGKIPGNLPEEFKQVRIENTRLFELPLGLFINRSTLEYLWLNFNNVMEPLEHLSKLKELRLEGNKVCSVPWAAFRATQLLRILDLKHNRTDVFPELALQVVSKSVFLNWPDYQKLQQPGCGVKILSSLVLALHNNPWRCDCRLRGLVQFVKFISLPIILVNPYLMCQSPVSKAGQLFHETELSACVKPQISTPSVNVTVHVGQNVTLQCPAQARPLPTIAWIYPLSMWREFYMLIISTAEDTALSGLVIPAAHLVDRGNYTCVPSNSSGRSTLVISLHVQPGQVPAYIDLRVVKQTVHGILLESPAVADTPEEKWFTLYIASDEALRKEVVHMGPGINTYAVNDLLPGMKYEACLSLGGQTPHQGQCVVFVTGRAQGGLEGQEGLLHITVVLCAGLLVVLVGTQVWAAQAPGSCREWGLPCCPLCRKALRCPHAVLQHWDSSYREHIEGHRDAEGDEENDRKKRVAGQPRPGGMHLSAEHDKRVCYRKPLKTVREALLPASNANITPGGLNLESLKALSS
ncbi:hypothetical protein MC885_006811, partial [Smutsia gigantea]